jgi:hypothetical protein
MNGGHISGSILAAGIACGLVSMTRTPAARKAALWVWPDAQNGAEASW